MARKDKHSIIMKSMETPKHIIEEQLEQELDTQRDYDYVNSFASRYNDSYGYRY